jgi:hypothetical protein
LVKTGNPNVGFYYKELLDTELAALEGKIEDAERLYQSED